MMKKLPSTRHATWLSLLLFVSLCACSDSVFTGFGDACASNEDCDEGVCVGGICQQVRPPASEGPPAPPVEGEGTSQPSAASDGTTPAASTPGTDLSTPNAGGDGTSEREGEASSSGASDPCEGVDLQTDPENCGECGRLCEFDQGVAGCNGGFCVLVDCEEGRRNCDGNSQTGCETPVDADPANCGECGLTCPAEDGFAICVEGTCDVDRCPAGQRVCEGKCEPANVCGGCADLGDALPDEACGSCGNLTCDAGTLVCQGEVDLQNDPNNCGLCGRTCKPEEDCVAGVCEEPPEALRVWIRSQSLFFGDLTSYLQELGHQVTRSQGGFFASTLDAQDVLILDSPAITQSFSPTPAQLRAWVEAGGGVIFIGGSSVTICSGLNPYLDIFGMRFSDASSASADCSGGGFSNNTNQSLSISAHPITRNDSINNTSLAQRNGWRIRDLGGASTRVVTLSTSTNREVLRTLDVGDGRVVVLSDGRIATNMEPGNQVFWRQAIEWVSGQR